MEDAEETEDAEEMLLTVELDEDELALLGEIEEEEEMEELLALEDGVEELELVEDDDEAEDTEEEEEVGGVLLELELGATELELTDEDEDETDETEELLLTLELVLDATEEAALLCDELEDGTDAPPNQFFIMVSAGLCCGV